MSERAHLPDQPLSANAAAEVLAAGLGGSTDFWVIWLKNARQPGRVNQLLKPIPGPGRPRYAVADLDAFIVHRKELAAQKSAEDAPKRVSPDSVQFPAHVSAITTDEGAGVAFVLLVTLSPLRSYKLTSAEARNLARRLLTAADAVNEQEAVDTTAASLARASASSADVKGGDGPSERN